MVAVGGVKGQGFPESPFAGIGHGVLNMGLQTVVTGVDGGLIDHSRRCGRFDGVGAEII